MRLLKCLLAAGSRVYLIYSQAAQVVAKQEMDLTLPARTAEAETVFGERFKAQPGQLRVFGREEWFAPVASGSNAADAMVICPCAMGTRAAVAAGMSDNLIERWGEKGA
jgi:4-hydroxy-3-polyprenylbenzoate decarboxylase